MIRSHDTDVRGTRIHWIELDGPPGPPFLLLHGWGASVVKWIDAMPHLATYRRAIAMDFPGFGGSAGARGSHSPAWFAGAARAFMDEIGLERAILVGNSLGGLIAAYAAAAWPERCEGIVLCSPVFPSDGPRPPASILAGLLAPTIPGVGELLVGLYMRRDPKRIVAESLERNCADPSRVPEATVRALEEEAKLRARSAVHRKATVLANRRMMWEITARREILWRTLRSIRVPTLLLWGDQDRHVPLHVGHRAVREIPGAQLVVLDDCGHNPQVECPEQFSAPVVAFARALAARESG